MTPEIENLVRRALAEDVGRGDVTTELTVDPDARTSGKVIAKSDLTVFGLEVAGLVFGEASGGSVRFETLVMDGERVTAGTVIAELEGPARDVLRAERVALNLLMRLSGVATLAARYVSEVEGTHAKVVDTRKTTPGLRSLEKAAVVAGGAVNHRYGLDDGILIKDNHIALAGGVTQAVRRAKNGAPHLLKVEVEVEDREQLRDAVGAGADVVLLDNMTPAEVRSCVEILRTEAPEVVIEVSGNVGLDTIRDYAEAGPDLISVGAMTHSAVAADISLDLIPAVLESEVVT